MTDLASLAAELLPGAALAGPRAAGRTIAWVRVLRARVPAFDALDAGDLVIAPASALAVVAPGAPELAVLASALAAAPVSGVVLVAGDEQDGGVAAAADAFVAAGLPTACVPRTDPQELERSLVGYIVARGAELERQATLLESELRRRALEGSGVAALVAVVSGFLGRAVALEAARGSAIVVHAPADAPASASAAARYHGRGRVGDPVALRVPLPSAAGAEGALAVLGAEPPSELVRVTLPRVAGLLALELAREEAIQGAAERARRAEPMPGAGPPWMVALARQREPGAEDDAPPARERREAVRREVRLLAPARRLALRGDADSIEVRLVLAGGPAEAWALAEQVRRVLDRPLAVSRPFATPAERPAAEAEARATLDAVLALDAPPPIARADRLPAYRMLGAVHKLPDGPRLAAAVLDPLLAARPDVRRERLQTLRALLAYGSVGEAAAALGIHRNTVAYRLRGIEAATGWRLADPQLRLPLAVALELVQDEQL